MKYLKYAAPLIGPIVLFNLFDVVEAIFDLLRVLCILGSALCLVGFTFGCWSALLEFQQEKMQIDRFTGTRLYKYFPLINWGYNSVYWLMQGETA